MRRTAFLLFFALVHTGMAADARSEPNYTITAYGEFASIESASFGSCVIQRGDKAELVLHVSTQREPYLTLAGRRHFAAIIGFKFTLRRGNQIIAIYQADTLTINDPVAPTGHVILENKEQGALADRYSYVLAGQGANLCNTPLTQAKTFELVVTNDAGGDFVRTTDNLTQNPNFTLARNSNLRLYAASEIVFFEDIPIIPPWRRFLPGCSDRHFRSGLQIF